MEYLYLCCGIIFFTVATICYWDEEKEEVVISSLPIAFHYYPFAYHLNLEHLWARRTAKILFVIGTIIWFLLPIFSINVYIAPTYAEDTISLTIGTYILIYCITTIAWFLGQVILYYVCMILMGIGITIVDTLKNFVSWLKA